MEFQIIISLIWVITSILLYDILKDIWLHHHIKKTIYLVRDYSYIQINKICNKYKSIKNYLQFMDEYKLTPSEFLRCEEIIRTNHPEDMNELLKEYLESLYTKRWDEKLSQELQNKESIDDILNRLFTVPIEKAYNFHYTFFLNSFLDFVDPLQYIMIKNEVARNQND